MPITTEINDKTAIIKLSGGIDYSMQNAFKEANDQALAANEVTNIEVDFKDASFLDSAGIRALISLKKTADELGKTLLIKNCNETIFQIFEIGGFNTMFTFQQ